MGLRRAGGGGGAPRGVAPAAAGSGGSGPGAQAPQGAARSAAPQDSVIPGGTTKNTETGIGTGGCPLVRVVPADCPARYAGRQVSETEAAGPVHKPVPLPVRSTPALTSATDISLPFDHHVLVYGPGNPHLGWWQNLLTNWEPQTFRVFHSFIGDQMVYVGFGEWNGVTALFASHYAHHALALEPDPPAFEHLRRNIEVSA